MKKQEFKAQCMRVCFVCLIFLVSVSPLRADMVRNIQFSESDLQLVTIKAEDGNEYTKPEMKEYLPYGREGQPALPVRFEKLLIPSDQDVGSIEILETRESVITGTYKIMPLQPDKPITPIPGQEEGFIGPDPSIYAQDRNYCTNSLLNIIEPWIP